MKPRASSVASSTLSRWLRTLSASSKARRSGCFSSSYFKAPSWSASMLPNAFRPSTRAPSRPAEPASKAFEAGFRKGDVILELAGTAVTSAAQLKEVWAKSSGSVTILLLRDGGSLHVAVKH